MPRRSIWSARQRAALFDLPTDEAALLRHYTLSDDDIEQIRVRRGGHNRLGFALQLCAFRYPGRILVAGEAIPPDGAGAADGAGAENAVSWRQHRDVLRRAHGGHPAGRVRQDGYELSDALTHRPAHPWANRLAD